MVKKASYTLSHASNMLLRYGATQMLEKKRNQDSDYLQKLPKYVRKYEATKAYPPYQVFIGGIDPERLKEIEEPWYEHPLPEASRSGKFGEIMPEDELYGLMKAVDVFDLVFLKDTFSKEVKKKLEAHPFLSKYVTLENLGEGKSHEKIKSEVESGEAPLYLEEELVGCVRAASEEDENLSAHLMLELLANKATGVLSLVNALENSEIEPNDIDFILECSEEASGDIYNRGGGGIGKSIGEAVGCKNATGIDLKAFCAAPAHAVVQAAALVKSGLYENVAVVAGGSVAKLGMNAKDHIKNDKPVLEDVLGGLAILVSANDGENPLIKPVGKQKIGAGSSPKAVLSSLVVDPLDDRITSIDKYAPELQAREILGRSIARSNYKMLGALAAVQGEIEKNEIDDFADKHGVVGFAPQQGHIPSGVPYIGHAREKILNGEMQKAMIIGKGSLFLGRMTKLFDGVSFMVEKNVTEKKEKVMEKEKVRKGKKVGVTLPGSEHGKAEIVKGAELAAERNPSLNIKLIGPKVDTDLEVVEVPDDEEAAHEKMEELLSKGMIDASVTLHYNFPLGVATVGRVTTPNGDMLLSTTTGTTSSDRIEALTLNAIAGIAAGKSIGVDKPKVGILNIEGGRECERILKDLKENGYGIHFAESIRPEAGSIMRGNDVLQGSPDVMVCDSLTGNVLIKLLSAFTTGGRKETFGYGYGPGIGKNANHPICILSRASGSPVIANAIEYAAQSARGQIIEKFQSELEKAKEAGLDSLLEEASKSKEEKEEITQIEKPPEKEASEEIEGIDVMKIEEGLRALWAEEIYAESGMGCTGPVIMVNEKDEDKAREVLKTEGFI